MELRRKSPDAACKMQAAEATCTSGAGFIADKAMWMRATGNSLGARDLLARRAVLAFRPSDPEEWYEALLTNAQAASNDQQWTTAYAIASRVDDAYAAGNDLSAQSLDWMRGVEGKQVSVTLAHRSR